LPMGTVTTMVKIDRAVKWIERNENPGIRPRDLITAKVAKNAEEANGICDRLVAESRAEWRPDLGKRSPRLYLVSTQHSAGSEAA